MSTNWFQSNSQNVISDYGRCKGMWLLVAGCAPLIGNSTLNWREIAHVRRIEFPFQGKYFYLSRRSCVKFILHLNKYSTYAVILLWISDCPARAGANCATSQFYANSNGGTYFGNPNWQFSFHLVLILTSGAPASTQPCNFFIVSEVNVFMCCVQYT